jgi:nitrite reductase/ring-hydroxylating ferredoxin subunit
MPWFPAAAIDEVAAASMLEVEVNGKAVLLYNLPAGIRATSAICPHHAAWLSDGRINGDCIDCPRHMGRFEIETGAQKAGPPSPPLPTYAVRIDQGQVFIEMPP